MPSSEEPSPLSHERFAQWMHEHGAAVRGYLRGVLRREHAAEDLAQETFRKAWEARERYREETKARAYLLRIADRLAIDYIRSHARRETNGDEALLAIEHREREPSAAIEHGEQRQALERALSELNEIQRRVLLLRYYGECEFAEIAEELVLPLGTVLSHCRRGLERLRTIFPTDEP